MFENFRDKIQNVVPQDLSTSLKVLTITEKISSNSVKKHLSKTKKVKVDLNAGAELLHHYQQHWENLHKQSEANAKIAEEVASVIDRINESVMRKNAIINEFISLVSSIPSMHESVGNVVDDLKQLEKNILLVEQRLTELEEAKQDEAFKKMNMNQAYEVALYREKKSAQFEEYKVNLAIMHTEKVKKIEKMQKLKYKERQQAFQAAFEEELNQYKIHGKVERQQQQEVEHKEKSLEEIQIESDEADLKAFDDFLRE
ncbi:dysbindin-like protein [Dinothrombium tinctorium]|uniref:Dysbindin-like protein n=1 Tax=Dinothrombium tinctorium TaxID=1965070 RepID=A0A3S3PKQ8_9ACAR|nr:dysbindin-like protein [Dinothrombium tinctorium]RWS17830.1 dysbindin-like protein [Dinothrombium tinctorium]RWS17838.1 dysbindin-like protein [Dinothrombium tinctorium]